MTRQELVEAIHVKGSFLCVGLDPDLTKLPDHLRHDATAVVTFCKEIIAATSSYCCAYKLNIAFFEGLGPRGWDILYETRAALPPDCFLIADAKRADIGNSSMQYARTFFEHLNFDAITVAPYMGEDSVRPFLEFEGKWTILLALTSNPGASDFQFIEDRHGKALFQSVLLKSKKWGHPGNLMYVAGATQSSFLSLVRDIVPEHFLLIPGIGVQGGSLDMVTKSCLTSDCGILVNSTREIIYASNGQDYAAVAGARAKEYQMVMSKYLSR